MKSQIARKDIISELINRGFIKAYEKDKATGWKSPLLDNKLYLKNNDDHPLVIHHKFIEILQKLTSSPGTKLKKKSKGKIYSHSTGFNEFKGPLSRSQYGLDFGFDSTHALNLFINILTCQELSTATADEDIETIRNSIDPYLQLPREETERNTVIAARRGQGLFRNSLDNYWNCCAVTGCASRPLLRASHIKPWRESNNTDRLNPYNGLLLVAHLDAAFDQGLISFDDDGNVLINSARLSSNDAAAVGIHENLRLRQAPDPRHVPFLKRHRALHGF